MTGALAGLLAVLLITSAPADDTARDRQWQLQQLRLPEAWRTSRGEGVLVAVLDTGVDDRHPDLRGVVTQGPDLTGSTRPRKLWGHHGTAMASLIAGHGHGDGRGVLGVAPAAMVLSIRVTLENDDPQRGKQSTAGRDALARGIRYAVDHGADIVSMSLGGGSGSWEGSADEEEAVQYALERGAVLVASSGNDGDTTNRKNFPAAYPGVIAVGAVDRSLKVARFSNRQEYLSVVAPGTGIISADGPDSYVIGDGTSSAAAMVTGIAALIMSKHPDLTPLQVRRSIERGTRARPYGGHNRSYGHGVVNAWLALKEAAKLARPTPLKANARPSAYFGGGPPPGEPSSRIFVVLSLVLLAGAMGVRVVVLHLRQRKTVT
ncbi:type VII secretion-associated serine protease mycosin [Nonomuraea sp. NPDC050556]|uniref:type VII secretion-associated serine protease mycosin n=1 Tax=Nonomuraea sp. NPDC050556 TaxID=3364369 RepID=UPI00379CAD94